MWLFKTEDVESDVVAYCMRKFEWLQSFANTTIIIDTLLLRNNYNNNKTLTAQSLQKLCVALAAAGFDAETLHEDPMFGTTVRITKVPHRVLLKHPM